MMSVSCLFFIKYTVIFDLTVFPITQACNNGIDKQYNVKPSVANMIILQKTLHQKNQFDYKRFSSIDYSLSLHI
jgi:hypothetical protein